VQVKHAFQVQNKGGSALIIKEAKPTCDCTTVKLDKTQVPGGKSTDLVVIVDTTMKMGEIKKEILISTNDPLHPQSKVTVIAQVDPHAGMSAVGPSKLFSAKCGVCHVTPGIGKMGEDLYLADCAMCHGFRADGVGASAPSLVRDNLEDKAKRARLRQLTAFGSKTNPTAMPGFIKEAGGPLTGAEVDSLIEYLRWRQSVR
jgi:cytochrome c553